MKELVIASNNQHKIKEISKLAGGKIRLLSLKDIGFKDEIPEDYNNLKDNAREKAYYIYNRYGVECFADDTGLAVKCLNGKPGAYSARYAGENATFEENICKLLRKMNGKTDRRAEFRTIICLLENGGKENLFEGVCSGYIIEDYKGSGGFGYDSVFVPEGESRTFAQMTLAEKNAISHRSQAICKLFKYLFQ